MGVRVGILGLGRSGWGIHAMAVAEHPGFDVVAVADPVAERRDEAAERFGCAAYPDPRGVLDDDAVDLVVVATPSHTHVPLTLEALERGRNVVVEKPMAQTTAEVDVMIAAASRIDRVLTCYLPRRLDPDFLAVRAALSSGRLGRPVLVRRTIHEFMRRADWQTLRKFDGGILSNTVPHLLDQVLQLADPSAELELLADLRHTVGAGDAEDHAKLTLRPLAGSGPLLEVEASSVVAIPQPAWWVIGTAGAVSGSPPYLTVRWSDPSSWGPLSVDGGPAAGRRYGTRETLDWTEERLDIPPTGRSRALQFYDALEAALRDGLEPPVTPTSVRRQVDILERARRQTGYL